MSFKCSTRNRVFSSTWPNASSPHAVSHLRKQEEVGGGSELGRNIKESISIFFFVSLQCNTLSQCQTPCPCSVGWMWGYEQCQHTVWHKKKAFPSLTILALCLVTASFCQFQPASLLWSCEDIFSPWSSDRQIKTRFPPLRYNAG